MSRPIPPARLAVLVVEDQAVLRMTAVDLVEDAGFESVQACDADEAVRILEQRPDIRIVFTDIDMPGGVDGMKLAATIRDRWPPIEIIMTSGKRSVGKEDMPARGVFLSKPYKSEDVVQAMQQMATANA